MQLITIQPEALFQALADETRLRIIRLLAITDEEACLCELVDSLQEPAYKLCRHLKILRQTGLLSSKKDGRWVYHRLVSKPSYLETLYQTVRALPGRGRRDSGWPNCRLPNNWAEAQRRSSAKEMIISNGRHTAHNHGRNLDSTDITLAR